MHLYRYFRNFRGKASNRVKFHSNCIIDYPQLKIFQLRNDGITQKHYYYDLAKSIKQNPTKRRGRLNFNKMSAVTKMLHLLCV